VSQLDRRQLLRIFGGLAAAGVAGAAAGCTSNPEGNAMEHPSGRTIVVGFIAPAVGPYGPVGDEIHKGVKLYLAETGYLVGTHRVDLRIAEEGASAESAKAAVKSLLSQNVIAIGGVANPGALGVVADAAGKARVPLITSAASPATFARSQAYTWRAAYVQGEAGRAMAPYARGEGERVYVMHDDTPASREEANAFAATIVDLGGTVVSPAVTTGSFAARLQSAENLGANSIFAAFTGNAALDLLIAYGAANLQIKLLVRPATESVDWRRSAPSPSRYTAGFYAPDLDNEDNRRSSPASTRSTASSRLSAMAGYDTMSVLDKMLRLVEGTSTRST
jgi:branched-chain amino acid transport system substrate-binding protein